MAEVRRCLAMLFTLSSTPVFCTGFSKLFGDVGLVLVLLGSGCFLIPAWFWRRSMIFVLIAYKYMFLH